jgi:hypothetical protein
LIERLYFTLVQRRDVLDRRIGKRSAESFDRATERMIVRQHGGPSLS